MSNLQIRAKRALFLMPLLFTLLLEGTKNELLTAACKNNEKHAFWLIEQKQANFTDVDSNGWTPLHYAVKNGMQKLVNYLIKEHNFDVNKPTKDKWRPVHIAALHGNLDILKRLQKSGAIMDVVLENDCMCDNAFTLAARKKYKDVMVYCMSLMPFAWTEGGLPSFPNKICVEMRQALTKEILGLSSVVAEIAAIDLLTNITSHLLQRGACAHYFLELTRTQETKLAGLVVSDFKKNCNFPEIQQCSLLILQYLKFFFYKESGSSKKDYLRELSVKEKLLCGKFSIPVLSIYYLNNLKKSVLNQNEYARRPFEDLKINVGW